MKVLHFVSVWLMASCSTVRADVVAALPHVYKYASTVELPNVEPEPMVASYHKFVEIADTGAKTITLRIDSSGGSVFLGLKWIQMVTDVKKSKGIHVDCIVDGSAYSMAAVILESPVCDTRLATPASTILFHNGSGGAEGTVTEIQHGADMLAALNVAMSFLIAPRMQLTPEEYRSRIAANAWVMAAPEALASHVIDGIASSEDIAPPVEG